MSDPKNPTLIKFKAEGGDTWQLNEGPEGVELIEFSNKVLPLVVVTWHEKGVVYDIRTDYDNIWPYMEEVLDLYEQLLALAPERLHSEINRAVNPYRMDLV